MWGACFNNSVILHFWYSKISSQKMLVEFFGAQAALSERNACHPDNHVRPEQVNFFGKAVWEPYYFGFT
ncbi:hypothetical protein SUGI_0898890 [Cryptomeria japonica]|nr:hypothetical protein SUGI_0898890 [Cryptomeria japonica]